MRIISTAVRGDRRISRNRRQAKMQSRYSRIMFAGLLGAASVIVSVAQAAPQAVELSSINGSNGFKAIGEAAGDSAGASVCKAGDVNGDGFDDVIIGAYYAANARGSSYVVFGKSEGFEANLKLSALNGTDGFKLHGGASADQFGISVSGGGDINNDGFSDLIASAHGFGSAADTAYVVFGKASAFPPALTVSALSGTDGFKLTGVHAFSNATRNVDFVGDFNGDGIDDLIVGASAVGAAAPLSGKSYVVFGTSSGFPATVDLESLTAANGLKINGVGTNDRSGLSAAGAGDVNGDGLSDLIIGAYNAANAAGASYVVFGDNALSTDTLELSSLDGSTGFRLDGSAMEFSGFKVSPAGDFNNDGFDDVVLGTFKGDRAYVIFGKGTAFPAAMALPALTGANGFQIYGVGGDAFGTAVSAAGDFNSDGFDDVMVGALSAAFNGDSSGATYVIFGKASGFPAQVSVATLASTEGRRFNGEATYDAVGANVSDAGDVNGDGLPDLIIGATGKSANAGTAYVVFGPRLDVSRMDIKLNFATPSKDSISLKGFAEIPFGFAPLGKLVGIDVGGSTRTLVLDAKAKAMSGFDSITMKIKTTDGTVATQLAPFSASFKKGNFASLLSDDGLIDADVTGAAVEIPVTLNLDGSIFRSTVVQSYIAKQGKSCKASNLK